ncbi:FMN-linked oxidoreductase [Thozetella sp. PMI_491]|nr:FMN-linked oxidoreductase [Thozetella sp. PMI_491]
MASEGVAANAPTPSGADAPALPNKKLRGRAFYESIGSPKFIIAPMVDQSEFAWRMLSRSFMPEDQRRSILAYSPMMHARHFSESQKYRDKNFQPTKEPLRGPDAKTTTPYTSFLDGNPAIDRPLFVQFCANEPSYLLAAAKLVAPFCDAVDLNLGCPQGIARKGHYGAFLQEDQELIYNLIHALHENLDVPVTAKIRILETKEATLKYAQNVLSAGASILTVHGRRREQKGHYTGLADWKMIRYLRDNLPPETVLFANGNILEHGDLEKCLEATGADGIMSAEGNLSNPGIFATPPDPGHEEKLYWRGKDGRGGWRVDEVMRRYLDILYQYALGQEPPQRRPLFMPGDDTAWVTAMEQAAQAEDEPPTKKQKKEGGRNKESPGPNLGAVQPHLFHLLRHFVARHHDVRDLLARARQSDMAAFEKVMDLVELKVAQGLLEYERTDGKSVEEPLPEGAAEEGDDPESSQKTVRECKRPWWVVQPIVRPLPKEALAKGAVRPKAKKAKPEAGAGTEAGAAEDKVVEKVVQEEPTRQEVGPELLEAQTDYTQSELVSG